MTLKNVLLVNAISSGITGILLSSMPAVFAGLFGVDTTAAFTEVGIFLVLFSLYVIIAAFKNPIRKDWTRFIIAMDVIWVVASLIAVLFLFSSISFMGTFLILVVAAWVGLMAYLQRKQLSMV